jgi:hypothetical protein
MIEEEAAVAYFKKFYRYFLGQIIYSFLSFFFNLFILSSFAFTFICLFIPLFVSYFLFYFQARYPCSHPLSSINKHVRVVINEKEHARYLHYAVLPPQDPYSEVETLAR